MQFLQNKKGGDQKMDELWDDYFQYLIWLCRLEKEDAYAHLFEVLHHIDFTWILDRDDNRDEDGLDLRDDYTPPDDFDTETIESFYEQKTSVFEMLVALSIRVDNEYIGDPIEEHPEIFFMEMIKNLGLDCFKGKRYRDQDVIKIIKIWLDRKFKKNGVGSPFPVRKDSRDQRKLEIWDQMNSYISENYF